MKTILKTLLALLVATSVHANTNMLWLDYTTPHGSGVYGDSWPVTANKINVNFSNLIGAVVGGGLGGGSNFYSSTNYITTNLYLTQNNYSYTTTNQYTGGVTWYSNVYTGSNYFNYGTNLYQTWQTNFFFNYYTGAGTNTIEKFAGGGVDTTITNTLTLINTNVVLGYNFSQLLIISTNQLGVWATNIYTRTNAVNNGYVSTNGDIFVYLPVIATGEDPVNPTFPPVDGYLETNGVLTPATITPVRGYQATVYRPDGDGQHVAYGTDPTHLKSLEGSATTLSGSGEVIADGSYGMDDWLVSWAGRVSSSIPTDNPPIDGKVYTGGWDWSGTGEGGHSFQVIFSGYTKSIPSFPTNFIPSLGAGESAGNSDTQTLPLWLKNYIVLRPQTNACGSITNYLVIGWNPYGSMSGWLIYSNAFGYVPAVVNDCTSGKFTTNWLVYHQGVWFPYDCIVQYQGLTTKRSVALFPAQVSTNYGVDLVGVHLNNQSGNGSSFFLTIGTSALTFDLFYTTYYNLSKWVFPGTDYYESDPVIWSNQPTYIDEPSFATMSGVVWQPWFTNRTSTSSNYVYVMKTDSSVSLPAMPDNLVDFFTHTPSTPLMLTNVFATNQMVVVTNTIINAQPIYQYTKLYSRDDSALGINQAGTPIVTYTGQVEAANLSSNAVAYVRDYPSNTWNWNSVTNGMKDGGFRTAPSNGAALVDLWMSNGVVRMWSRPF